MKESISSALKDWIPFKLFEESGQDHCRWLYLGNEIFTDPFFDETIRKCWKLPYNSSRYRPESSLEALPEWSQQIESILPTAFIFHVSRCGSTLVSQLLGLNPANIVLSEVPFIDDILQSGFKKNRSSSSQLKAAIRFYAAKRNEQKKYLFIKTDSWHIHFYNQLRQLYPQVPFILLYRRPDEVVRSHQKKRGIHAVQGLIDPAIFDLTKQEIADLSIDEYLAKVLESYFTGFINILQNDNLAIPLNYNEGAVAIVKKIASITGIALQADEMETIKQRSGFHGKYPEQKFAEPLIETTIPAYQQKVFELYETLEKLKITSIVKY